MAKFKCPEDCLFFSKKTEMRTPQLSAQHFEWKNSLVSRGNMSWHSMCKKIINPIPLATTPLR